MWFGATSLQDMTLSMELVGEPLTAENVEIALNMLFGDMSKKAIVGQNERAEKRKSEVNTLLKVKGTFNASSTSIRTLPLKLRSSEGPFKMPATDKATRKTKNGYWLFIFGQRYVISLACI
ncbi:hypothetical protein GN244_ATG05412 [Phytophthora infestans]|uniref:Uncharacterized protein n=1 Tax=Phytophthora infestans TaxID=4787 RepID=A0A833T4Q0_PHYIN|nr:hypothetical protein GN244_ATG05412 [Phytophthora infestans]